MNYCIQINKIRPNIIVDSKQYLGSVMKGDKPVYVELYAGMERLALQATVL